MGMFFSQEAIDAQIFDGTPNTNSGEDGSITIGETGGIYRALIKLDLSPIPTGQIMVGAFLSLFVRNDFSTNARTIRAYRVKRAWTEGGVTWNKYNGSDSWGAAGCGDISDRELTDIGKSFLAANLTDYHEIQIALDPAKVQEWISGAMDNNGLLLQMDTESGDCYQYRSQEDPELAYRPKLTVFYAPAAIVTNSHALRLSGAYHQFLELKNSDQTGLGIVGDITLEADVMFTSLPADTITFVSKWAGGAQCSYLFCLAGAVNPADIDIVLLWSDTGSFTEDGNARVDWTPTIGVKYHVAVTLDASTAQVKFYVDGVQQGATQTKTATSIFDSTADIEIGTYSGGAGGWLYGVIDNIRVWDVIRSITEIADNKDLELIGNEEHLQLYLKLNHNYLDATANHNDFCPYGATPPIFIGDVRFGGVSETVNSYAASGCVNNLGAVFATIRGAATGDNKIDVNAYIGAEKIGGTYYIYRAFEKFLLALPENAVIMGMRLRLWVDSKDTTQDFGLALQSHTVPDETLAIEDFDALTLNTPVEFISVDIRSIPMSGVSTPGYLDLELNDAAIASTLAQGMFKIAIRSTADTDNWGAMTQRSYIYTLGSGDNPTKLIVYYKIIVGGGGFTPKVLNFI